MLPLWPMWNNSDNDDGQAHNVLLPIVINLCFWQLRAMFTKMFWASPDFLTSESVILYGPPLIILGGMVQISANWFFFRRPPNFIFEVSPCPQQMINARPLTGHLVLCWTFFSSRTIGLYARHVKILSGMSGEFGEHCSGWNSLAVSFQADALSKRCNPKTEDSPC